VAHHGWTNTTHDWMSRVDVAHLRQVRAHAAELAPTGCLHLILEVLAYAADEADSSRRGHATATLLRDGSVRIVDDGRGTDTRRTSDGRLVRKPVMATKDLRFFDTTAEQLLPDGHRRRGMSVVAALSDWLVHVNRRIDGAWEQRYERGVPVTDLEPVTADGTTGTSVHFKAGIEVAGLDSGDLRLVLAASTPWLTVDVIDERR
jgi:DNA gyrase subunit B